MVLPRMRSAVTKIGVVAMRKATAETTTRMAKGHAAIGDECNPERINRLFDVDSAPR